MRRVEGRSPININIAIPLNVVVWLHSVHAHLVDHLCERIIDPIEVGERCDAGGAVHHVISSVYVYAVLHGQVSLGVDHLGHAGSDSLLDVLEVTCEDVACVKVEYPCAAERVGVVYGLEGHGHRVGDVRPRDGGKDRVGAFDACHEAARCRLPCIVGTDDHQAIGQDADDAVGVGVSVCAGDVGGEVHLPHLHQLTVDGCCGERGVGQDDAIGTDAEAVYLFGGG